MKMYQCNKKCKNYNSKLEYCEKHHATYGHYIPYEFGLCPHLEYENDIKNNKVKEMVSMALDPNKKYELRKK